MTHWVDVAKAVGAFFIKADASIQHSLSRGTGLGTTNLLLTTIILACGNNALGFTGSDPAPVAEECSITEITAELKPDGGIQYSASGVCNGDPVAGEMAYSAKGQMQEEIYYKGTRITTMAVCRADPFVTGSSCEGGKISAEGRSLNESVRATLPFSSRVVGASLFQSAKAKAPHPRPPGPPVNLEAISYPGIGADGAMKVKTTWLSPDENDEYGSFLRFELQSRPQNAKGARWNKIGEVSKHRDLTYSSDVRVPVGPKNRNIWEVRVCSMTVYARTCTLPILPVSAILSKPDKGKIHAPHIVSPDTKQDNNRKTVLPDKFPKKPSILPSP